MDDSDDSIPNVPLPRRARPEGASAIVQARNRLYGEPDGTADRSAGAVRWGGVADRERSATLARSVVARSTTTPGSWPSRAPDPPDEPHHTGQADTGQADTEQADVGPVEVEQADPGRERRRRAGPSRTRLALVSILVLGVLGLGIIVGLVLAPREVSAVAAASAPSPFRPTMIGQVVAVRDGSTITVQVGDRPVDVVILGLDTPDPASPGRPAQCGAGSAAAYAADTLTGQVVTLVPDPSVAEFDAEGRRQAYVVLRSQASYTDLALSDGIGRHSTSPTAWYDAVFAREEATARDSGAGIWGAPCRANS